MTATRTGRRALIVNADDFGQSAGVNRGVVAAHERGIVTSASLLVRWPGAAEAAEYARGRPRLGLGLHIDLGEWAYRAGAWVSLYEVVNPSDAAAVEAEVARQLAAFRHLTGRDPTHIDSHQHVHRDEPLRSILVRLAGQLGVPLRHFAPGIAYCGEFYGQAQNGEPYAAGISLENLVRIVRGLRPGVTELACHPGFDDDLASSMYRAERARETAVLCHTQARAVIAAERIELRSFATRPEP